MDNPLDLFADRITFISYGGGHAAALAPVAHELERRGVPCVILGLTTAAAYFARQSLAAIGVADIVNHVPGYVDASKVGLALAAHQPLHSNVSADETSAYLGIGYVALERQYGAEEAQRRYARLNRQSFCPVDFFDQLFSVARPQVLVATNAPRSEQAALIAAGKAKIPSLCLVDLYAAFEIDWCASPGYADRICVMNEAIAERFRMHGALFGALRVTGNPAFDRLGRLDTPGVRARYRSLLGLRETDRLLLWISQPEPLLHPFSGRVGDPTLPVRIEAELAATFENDPSVHLVMRLHPSEDRPPAVAGDRIRYGTADEPLDDLLCAADCVVTCSSTVGVEAALLGKPVVQIMRSIFSPDLPLEEMGYAKAAHDSRETETLVRNAFREPAATRSAHHRLDAAIQVADQIVILSKKPVSEERQK